jgi:hypothetical protein
MKKIDRPLIFGSWLFFWLIYRIDAGRSDDVCI